MSGNRRHIDIHVNGRKLSFTVNKKKNKQADHEKDAHKNETLNWVIPFQNEEKQRKAAVEAASSTEKFFKKPKKNKVLFSKLWLPLISAIIIGLGFGFSALLMFHHEGKTASATLPAEDKALSPSNAEAPSLDYQAWVLQAGVLSDSSSADQEVSRLKAANQAAVSVKDQDGYHILIGIGAEKNDIAKTGTQYYAKKWKMTHSETPGFNHEIQVYLQQGETYLSALIKGEKTAISSDWKIPAGLDKKTKQQFISFEKNIGIASEKISEGEDAGQPLLDSFRDLSRILQP